MPTAQEMVYSLKIHPMQGTDKPRIGLPIPHRHTSGLEFPVNQASCSRIPYLPTLPTYLPTQVHTCVLLATVGVFGYRLGPICG
jgi:hypothetical protein